MASFARAWAAQAELTVGLWQWRSTR